MKTDRGFTIVELLIVIVVIGILAGFSFVGLSAATEKAKSTRTTTDLKNITKVINIAKQTTGKTLWQITKEYVDGTGNPVYIAEYQPVWNNHNCSPSVRGAGFKINNLPNTDLCIIDMKLTWDVIYKAAGVGIANSPPKDNWGSPYLLDANENEAVYAGYPQCDLTWPNSSGTNSDLVKSAGPDAISSSSPSDDDILANPLPTKIICS
ncbi:type II secretion system protein [Candidatus Saccharibacteria bacterium]|nr:type II secretion system protein [Candidatus Saccharibacteria bacterium]